MKRDKNEKRDVGSHLSSWRSVPVGLAQTLSSLHVLDWSFHSTFLTPPRGVTSVRHDRHINNLVNLHLAHLQFQRFHHRHLALHHGRIQNIRSRSSPCACARFPEPCALLGVLVRHMAAVFRFSLGLRRRRRGSAPARANHKCWNVQGLKKSPHTSETREKLLNLTTAASL